MTMKTQTSQANKVSANNNNTNNAAHSMFKKRVCGAILGLSMIFSAGCGMPMEHQQGLHNIEQGSDWKTVKPVKLTHYAPRWRVAPLLPSLKTDPATTLNPPAPVPAKVMKQEDANKVSADLSPRLAPDSTIAKMPGTDAKAVAPTTNVVLPQNTCLSGLRVLENQPANDGKFRLDTPYNMQWDVAHNRTGEAVQLYLLFDRNHELDMTKIEGEQPLEIERINTNTWKLTYAPQQEPGQHFKAFQFRANFKLYRLGICYKIEAR